MSLSEDLPPHGGASLTTTVGERDPARAAPPAAGPDALAQEGTVELSVVIPCLDEIDTIALCVEKALAGIGLAGARGEVIVADNGSTDGSREAARARGARVVEVPERGYGSALMAGIASARGKYIVMGDADASYDFEEIPRFVEKLREGHDLVQGCRLATGGGTVKPGAMPFLHRWWGNPMFSAMARAMFGAPVHDVYCGLRGFTRDLWTSLDQRCKGMEFATEMIVKASLLGKRIAEVPITLHPDGRKSHPPHLKTFRDGWRTLRFLLLYQPRWLFVLPGVAFVFAGLLGWALAFPRVTLFGVNFDAHTLLCSSLFLILGYQSLAFGLLSKTFAVNEGLLPPDPRLERILRIVTLERGIVFSALFMVLGIFLLTSAVGQWWSADFGPLDYSFTMRFVIPGVTLTSLGFQSLLSILFLSLLGMQRR
jgi:glycosyltransferase involved in cell wall biosynthesis